MTEREKTESVVDVTAGIPWFLGVELHYINTVLLAKVLCVMT